MQIKTETNSFLSIKDSNLGSIFFGFIFCLIGLLVFYLFLNYPTESMSTLHWIIPILFFVFGFLILFFSYSIIINFDKNLSNFIYSEKGFLFERKMSYSVSSIIKIQKLNKWKTREVVKKNISLEKKNLVSQYFLILKNDIILPLNQEKTSSSGIVISFFKKNKEKNKEKKLLTLCLFF